MSNRWLRKSVMVVAAVIIGWTAAGALDAPSASAASTCPGENGHLAVTVGTHGRNSEVIGVVTRSRRVRNVIKPQHSAAEALLEDPSFSCDGDEIAYSEDNDSHCEELQIVNIRTRQIRALGTPPICGRNPSFLSERRIVFDGSRGTYLVDADGSHLHRLFAERAAASTTDGRWFISSDFHHLFLLDAEGRRVRELVPPLHVNGGEYLHPHFSPDGRWIVYEKSPQIATESRKGDLFIVRRDGTHRRRLTKGHRSSEPVFSPDGRWIAFIRSAGPTRRNVFELSIEHPGTVKTLTRVHDANFYGPTWAPG